MNTYKLIYLPMRSIIFPLLLAAFLPISLVAQKQPIPSTVKIDARLYDVFQKEELDGMTKDDVFFIYRWNFYLDNAYFISDTPLSKDGRDEGYPSVNIADLTKINILKLESEQNLKHDFNYATIYKITGTGKYLVYYAGRHFVEKFNDYLNSVKGEK
jgi:hypothetical protein